MKTNEARHRNIETSGLRRKLEQVRGVAARIFGGPAVHTTVEDPRNKMTMRELFLDDARRQVASNPDDLAAKHRIELGQQWVSEEKVHQAEAAVTASLHEANERKWATAGIPAAVDGTIGHVAAGRQVTLPGRYGRVPQQRTAEDLAVIAPEPVEQQYADPYTWSQEDQLFGPADVPGPDAQQELAAIPITLPGRLG